MQIQGGIFYNRGMSPFLLIQPHGPALYSMQITHEPVVSPWKFSGEDTAFLKTKLEVVQYPVEELPKALSMEEAEDYYIEAAPIMPRYHDELTTFALNAQASVQAKYNRRGIGRTVLVHPSIFMKIKDLPKGGTQFTPTYEEMGRWRKVATETYRGLEVWLGEHLPQDEIITVYRPNTGLVDGMAVMRCKDGFALGPADRYSELSLIHRRRVI